MEVACELSCQLPTLISLATLLLQKIPLIFDTKAIGLQKIEVVFWSESNNCAVTLSYL